VFVDITSVIEMKTRAMDAMKAQSYLRKYYSELATRRANHARRISGNTDIKFAEAHFRILPWVVASL
jgi:4-oxalomesaconate hydratase